MKVINPITDLRILAGDFTIAVTKLLNNQSHWLMIHRKDATQHFETELKNALNFAQKMRTQQTEYEYRVFGNILTRLTNEVQKLNEYFLKTPDDLGVLKLFESAIEEARRGYRQIPWIHTELSPDTESSVESFGATPPGYEPSPKPSQATSNFDLTPYLTNQNFWWLQANPEYWTPSRKKVGAKIEYSTHGETKNKRRIFEAFFQAKKDELLVIYESSPEKKVKALAKVIKEAKNRDGDDLGFQLIYLFQRQTSWETLNTLPEFKRSQIAQNNQGSLFPLKKSEFIEIINTTELTLRTDGPSENPLQRVVIDNDGAVGQRDCLDFTKDVNSFATLIAMKDTVPPLAIALFGQWGSGKSFFMHQLKSTVKLLSENQGFPAGTIKTAQGNDKEVFCQGIVQIEFNAWSYLDANLWAGLVSTIFEKLDDYIDNNVDAEEEKEAVQKKLNERLHMAAEQKRTVMREKDHLATRKQEIEKEISTAEAGKDVLLKEIRANSLEKIKKTALEKVEPLSSEIRQKLKAFGITSSEADELSPNNIYNELKSWVTFTKNLLKFNPWEMTILLTSLVLLAVLLIDPWDWFYDTLKALQRYALIIVTLAGPVLVKFYNSFKKYKDLFGPVLAFKNEFNEQVQNAEHAHRNKLETLQAELAGNDLKLTELTATLASLENEIAYVESVLKHSITKQAFFNFINKKSQDGTYEKHMGIISTIRRDFETLSVLFKDSNESAGPPDIDSQAFRDHFKTPLDRIILYIDDLDRCPDDKVMEVLQAVHLLMAYPLFIVVVGVDKRCVHNALTHRNLLQYKSFTRDGDMNELKDIGINIIQPAEYLEKIFQIPFHLEEASDDSIKDMIEELLKKNLAKEEGMRLSTAGKGSTYEETSKSEDHQSEAGNSEPGTVEMDYEARNGTPGGQQQNNNMRPEDEDIDTRIVIPEQLKLSAVELAYMKNIAWMVGNTPRTIKRFINIYRIIRAHQLLSFQHELKEQTYMVLMFILAVNVGKYSTYSSLIFRNLKNKPDEPLRDILGTDVDQSELKIQLGESGPMKQVLDLPGRLFIRHIPLIKRFSFSTFQPTADVELKYAKRNGKVRQEAG